MLLMCACLHVCKACAFFACVSIVHVKAFDVIIDTRMTILAQTQHVRWLWFWWSHWSIGSHRIHLSWSVATCIYLGFFHAELPWIQGMGGWLALYSLVSICFLHTYMLCVCVCCVCVCKCVCVCARTHTDTLTHTHTHSLTGLWLITSNVVMLNMFIAILSEAYRKVGEEVQLERANTHPRTRTHMQRSTWFSDQFEDLKTTFSAAGLPLVLARLCASLSISRILVNVNRNHICFLW